jgi:putative transposase
MEKVVESLGFTRLSRCQLSVMAAELDDYVQAFRTRPLDAGPYTFVSVNAVVLRVREDGRVADVMLCYRPGQWGSSDLSVGWSLSVGP